MWRNAVSSTLRGCVAVSKWYRSTKYGDKAEKTLTGYAPLLIATAEAAYPDHPLERAPIRPTPRQGIIGEKKLSGWQLRNISGPSRYPHRQSR